jgi:hypothetical protein
LAPSPEIGFSQRIKLEWMDATARMVADGKADAEIVAALRDMLQDQLSVGQNPERGNREKAITILLKTWARVPAELVPFRDHGLRLLQHLPPEHHVAIHWASAMAAYPFFGEVAQTIGRLLRLQDNISAPQMQRRLKERFGERETVARAARRIQRTFVDWGVLRESGAKGTYLPSPPIRLADPELLAWMAEAAIRASEGRMKPVEEIRQSLAFFPFDVSGIDITTLPSNDALDVFRQGVDEHWARLR